jgi:hypothetical protein
VWVLHPRHWETLRDLVGTPSLAASSRAFSFQTAARCGDSGLFWKAPSTCLANILNARRALGIVALGAEAEQKMVRSAPPQVPYTLERSVHESFSALQRNSTERLMSDTGEDGACFPINLELR